MKNYQKPIVLLNTDLAEGVYAASGSLSDYRLTYKRTNILGEKVYNLVMINTSNSPVKELTVTLNLNNVTSFLANATTLLQNGEMNVSSTVNGNTATVKCIMLNKEIPAHGETPVITVVVYGEGEFSVQER